MKFLFVALGLALSVGNVAYADAPAPVAPSVTPAQPLLDATTGAFGSAQPSEPKLLPFGVATLSVCNNRVNPANAAEMATQMLLGTPVEILGRERGYYQVKTPDGYVSWTEGSGVSLMDADAFQAWQRAEKIVVTAEYSHAYSAPSAKSLRVSDLVQGNILQLVEKQGGFFKVTYPDGRLAYVATQDAQNYRQWAARKNPNAAQILASAKTMMGLPYLWGGTSVKGVDCSGLTKTSFFLNGIVIPRDAWQQALVGEPVDITDAGGVSLAKCLKNLQPGDLLFFGSARSQSEAPRVTHTAIYMGNGEFIQAAGLVRINSMDPKAANYSDYGRRKLLSARRMLPAIGTDGITRLDSHPSYRGKS